MPPPDETSAAGSSGVIQPDLQIEIVVTEPFSENTLIVWNGSGAECVVVDPGFESPRIIRRIEELGKRPVAILLTHGHVDHIAGVGPLKSKWSELPILIGQNDAPMLGDAKLNLSVWGGMPITAPPADRLLVEGDTVEFAGLTFSILDIPGHSPGHIVYVWRQGARTIVLGGDVLFQGSVGRTDFPGGNSLLLLKGIRKKLFALPEESVVYPGHGPSTTIGAERRENPFCGDEQFR